GASSARARDGAASFRLESNGAPHPAFPPSDAWGRGVSQPSAFFSSAAMRFSTSAFMVLSAYDVGHMAPSSSVALSVKPKVAYRSLNFSASLKKQTTLSSFAYAGMPYQVRGTSVGACA